jgi:CheY-like chemotaxis protein
LPDQTGWDVLRAARSEGRLPSGTERGKLPVVLLSAVHVSLAGLTEFHPLAYLPKPFPMEALLRLAAEAASRRNGRATFGTEETAGSANPQFSEEKLYA